MGDITRHGDTSLLTNMTGVTDSNKTLTKMLMARTMTRYGYSVLTFLFILGE